MFISNKRIDNNMFRGIGTFNAELVGDILWVKEVFYPYKWTIINLTPEELKKVKSKSTGVYFFNNIWI